MRRFSNLTLWCLLILLPLSTTAQVDDSGLSFSYDGYLETIGGQPVNQALSFVFTLHSDPELNAPVWTETHANHNVQNGIVQITLGTINPVAPGLLTDPSLYLGVAVDGNAEMQPRLKLEAVLRAQWARHAMDVSGEVINPASVRVNGSEVIDSAGNWVGGGGAGNNVVRNDQNGTINGNLAVNRIDTTVGLRVGGNSIIDGTGRIKPSIQGGVYMGLVNGAHAYIRHANCGPNGPNNCSTLQLKVGNESGNDRVGIYSPYGIQLNGPGTSNIGIHWPASRWGVDANGVGNDAYIRFDRKGNASGQLRMVVTGNTDDDLLLKAPGGITLDGDVTVTGAWNGPDTMTAQQILTKLLTVDGVDSSMDADKLDGLSSNAFLRSDQDGSVNGVLSVTRMDSAQGLKVNNIDVIDAAGKWVGDTTMTPQSIRDALLQVDGTGSGIDADKLDGLSSESFVRNDQSGTINGTLGATTLNATQGLQINGAAVIDAGGNWVGPSILTPQAVRDNLLQADGAGSGIDADKLDGISSDIFVRNDQNGTVNGTLSASIVNAIQGMKVNGAEVIDADGNWVGPAILTPQIVLDNLLQADGAGSGIDADKLDGISSDIFVRNDQNGAVNGTLSASIVNAIQGIKVNGADVIDANGNWVGPAILTPQTVLDNLLQADGAGSAIDADFLDGISSETFVRNDQDATINGSVSATVLDASLGVRINGAGVIDAAGNWVGPDPLTAEEIRDKLIQVDGLGSSVDADLIDGLSSEQLLRNDQDVQLNGVLTATALVINNSIGIGTANPQTVLDVNGAIKIGSENECDAAHAGTLRYAANLMELCDGTQWQEILTAGGAPPGCTLEALEVDGQNVAHGRILSCRDQDPIRVQIMECGNGTIDGAETCDDGNFTNDDGCNDHCQIECGDGVVGANEACDDGNTIDTDACTASCTIATCGDGSIHEGTEECDGGQNCLADCTKPMCAKTGVCPDLDFVPLIGGVFSMGAEGGAANEKPVHQVTLSDFEILRNEVTVAQYKMCLDAGVCTVPKQGEIDLNWGRADRDQHPINGVNWAQARQFANWVGGDLPTEAQWEYAATSQGSNQLYPWGDEAPDCQRTHNYTCPGPLTSTVCTHPTGHSDQGVCDLAGNTWEWVVDNYHATYDGAPIDGSAWCNLASCLDDGEPRVWKGGDYRFDVTRMRSSARGYYGPAVQPAWMGFRVVR